MKKASEQPSSSITIRSVSIVPTSGCRLEVKLVKMNVFSLELMCTTKTSSKSYRLLIHYAAY